MEENNKIRGDYKEHKFSDDDRKNLRETGTLGRVVDLVDRETGEIIPSFVSIDRKTNEPSSSRSPVTFGHAVDSSAIRSASGNSFLKMEFRCFKNSIASRFSFPP